MRSEESEQERGNASCLCPGAPRNLIVQTIVMLAAFVIVAAPAQAGLVGACCLPCGGCIEVCAFECEVEGGLFQGEGGACNDGVCVLDSEAEGGIFQGPGSQCVDVFACPASVPGACCLQNGQCLDSVCVFDCVDLGGIFQGSGSLCSAVLCPVPVCPWDLNGNAIVGFGDLLILLANWGPCLGCSADFDGDGIVGFTDLLKLLSRWGPCP